MDETHFKIMEATMALVMEKGFDAMTTKDIAARAGVNESTLFRKFEGKKDVVLTAMEHRPWYPQLCKSMFLPYEMNLRTDLTRFAKIYFEQITPEYVSLSMGLRSPNLVEHTAQKIMKVPQVFAESVKTYFDEMAASGKLRATDTEALSIAFLSTCFGFVFFKASFGDNFTAISIDTYIQSSVDTFVNGIDIDKPKIEDSKTQRDRTNY